MEHEPNNNAYLWPWLGSSVKYKSQIKPQFYDKIS